MPTKKGPEPQNNLQFEKALWGRGVSLIAGVDEVGRGALAGPMVVCAVILDYNHLKQFSDYISQTYQAEQTPKNTNNDILSDQLEGAIQIKKYRQITDSKLLLPAKREELSQFIVQNCLCYSIFQISNKEIDMYGISACTQKAFAGAIKALKIQPEHILTDAFPINAYPQIAQTNITSGDKLSITISAASIVAKVFRDKLMCDLAKRPEFSMYGFAKHKGYGTKLHLEKISQHGVSVIHRRTFIHQHGA